MLGDVEVDDTPAGLIEELVGVPGGGQERMIARHVLRLTR